MNEIKSGIYLIEIANSTVYVGSSINLKKRQSSHIRSLVAGNHHNKILQNSWNKYGEIEFTLLEYVCPEDLLVREQYYIDLYRKTHNLANHAMIAGSRYGVRHSEETKNKLRANRIGKTHSEESKQKMRKPKPASAVENMKKAQQNKSESTKNKISNTLKGHPVQTDTRAKLSVATKKLWEDKDYREKQSTSMRRTHCKKGHEFTEETTSYESNGKRFCRLCKNERVRDWRRSRGDS